MTLEERRERLKHVQSGKAFATGYELLYRGTLKPFEVWQIPIEALVYNPFNGRIGSVVKSFEKKDHALDPENPKDAEVIEKFLWESKEDSNKKTYESIKRTGQIKVGIVTADGLIIDGNRRCSLMNRVRKDPHATQEEKDRCAYFKAVILPENAEQKDIMQLETSFQMGEDAKVDYNPIEKYLKCRDLEAVGFTRDEIANFMGITKKEVDTDLEILELMDQYLSYFSYDGIYTMAEGHEDSFQKLNTALKQYRSGVATMWDFTEQDINDLTAISFDYIRMGLPQDDIRDIFRKPGKNSSIFGNKDRWQRLRNKHDEIIESVPEEDIDDVFARSTGNDLTALLKARDNAWKKKTEEELTKIFKEAQDEVDSENKANAPVELINKAQNALASINPESQGFAKNAATILSGLKSLIDLANNLQKAAEK